MPPVASVERARCRLSCTVTGPTRSHLSLPGHELMLALKTPNVLLTLDIEGKNQLALPKDVQRDPLKGFLEHVDLSWSGAARRSPSTSRSS